MSHRVGPPSADAPLYKAAVSIGWNPTYTGEQAVKQKMIEPYLLHEFEEDFYGQTLRLLVTGYIRPVRVLLLRAVRSR
eukprot:COSAG02_NODE_1085_length_14692_cov_4.244775_7_plen_78_part_00